MRPTQEIEGCRAAHAALTDRLAGVTETVARQPSLLPDWSVAHVLAHLVGNANSVVRRLEASAADRIVDQYPGGAPGRAAEIEQLAAQPVGGLLAAVGRTSAAVDTVIDAYPDDAWGRLSRAMSGQEVPASAVVYSRWREVEVHLVDLGLGYSPGDWPAALVERWLPDLVRELPDRAGHPELMAWALGRGAAPALGPWGS